MLESKERIFKILVHEEKCTQCQICQLRCSFRFTGTFNPSRSMMLIAPLDGKVGAHISFTSGCDSCGICARYCPYGALEIRRETS